MNGGLPNGYQNGVNGGNYNSVTNNTQISRNQTLETEDIYDSADKIQGKLDNGIRNIYNGAR